MRNLKNKLTRLLSLILILVIFLISKSGCINANNEVKLKPEQSNVYLWPNKINYDSVFKIWVKDTIPLIKNWKTQKEQYIIKKDFDISLDSLDLEIVSKYFIESKEVEKLKDSKVKSIIELLKEYEEIPEGIFNLSFRYYLFFQPSSIESLKYDMTSEFNEIKIFQNNFISSYGYIRGRLSNKSIESISNNDRTVVKKIDFIWVGDSIVKKIY